MYRNVEMPSDYESLPLAQKEALWLGMLMVYEVPSYFDENYWVDEIVNASEITIYEDDVIALYKCYNDEYKIVYKESGKGISSSFEYFFLSEDDDKYANMWNILGDSYKDVSIRDYLRSKQFPITAEFWQ